MNLTLNAVEAMPNGGTLTIASRAVSENELRVEFKDTGEGMSRQQQGGAFSSLLSTTKAHGTGLGLALVKRVVETHHGELQIKSKLGKGTTITVSFPTT